MENKKYKNSKKIAKRIKALKNCADIKIKFTNNHDVINQIILRSF